MRGRGLQRGLLVLALLFGAGQAWAGTVYRCDTADGARSYVSKRIQRLEDLRTSRAYMQQFDTNIPEDIPGMTSLGTSSSKVART